jgi:uncharacterized protein YciI
MQFIVIAYDGTDEGALEHRLAAREAHLKLGDKMLAKGEMLYAGAILNDDEKMIGSTIICDFPSRKELDDWLEIEPYITGNVWEKIDIRHFRVGSSFVK